ncbi:hypothetical protein DGG96_17005 [Legionella qingyii]|uniref:Peptidase M48 domain-containing protein n=1 Tax=Legionella qingyii TaxID=2184757 RepID=A0A317TYY0_9GAMM|nr:M48 family metallopeptidase [Legionella qingyii]PWY54115.1 hypothetical protein DGG96_18585 [Legionella qingyii]PWY54467.1 hypothetical protein DGG96_17005 [Legionella qingyii]RUR21109.1 hypothetical protein ELY20_13430 [Legionella qingyii]HDP0036255.1 M48 family metalloprotease [Legionella pneumophila]
MDNFRKWIFIIFLTTLIPVLGVLVGWMVSNGYENQYEETVVQLFKDKKGIDIRENPQVLNQLKLNTLCNEKDLDPALNSVCDEFNQINNLKYYSSITLAFTALLFCVIFTLGFLSRNNRNILFYLFKPGLLLSQISAAILVIANASILIFSIYFAESFYFEKVHLGLIVSLGIVAGITAIYVLIKSFIPIKDVEAKVFGKILDKRKYPTIWQTVESVAKKVGTNAPSTIIAGMDPTFFVTEANILCLDGNVQGRSLFISLPFCRVLSKNEFLAILGHEMGHFIGEDTKWSRKFYPIYRRANDTILSLDTSNNEQGLAQLSLLPSFIFMNIFIGAFEKSEKAISRKRELNADSVGIKISSKEEMSSALLKAHIYQYVWLYTQQQMEKVLSEGKQIINISTFFAQICKEIPQDFMKNEIGNTHTSHPTDSHPPLSIRLNSMGLDVDSIYNKGINIESDQAITLIEDIETLEKELTDLEYYKLRQSS